MAGRGLFIFFIPFSVVTMLKAMEEVNVIVRVARTVTTIEITDIRDIMEIDTSGEGQIDMNEYTRYMLCSTGQLEIEILLGFEKQFHALDASGDGTVSLEDFPEGMGLKKIHKHFNGNTVTQLEVVPLENTPAQAKDGKTSKHAAGTSKKKKVHDRKPSLEQAKIFHNRSMSKGAGDEKVGAVQAILTIVLYLGIAVAYYRTVLGWSVADCVYFSFATITTVGYGDFNGGHGPGTMLFTSAFGFIGVGLIGVAVGEVVEAIEEMQAHARERMLDKVAADMLAGTAALSQGNRTMKAFKAWFDMTLAGRVLRVSVPVFMIGFVGCGILFATEDSDSPIMATDRPVITGFYVSIVTALGVGYGDFVPTSTMGRGMFILCIPVFVVLMFEVLDEVNGGVRWLRTTTTVEVEPITRILEMDDSGEGTVDVNEYVMYMVESSGTYSVVYCNFFCI
jgi:hypothetical protein